VTEDDVQRVVASFYAKVGGRVYDLSQGYRPGPKRHATTRQTPGLGDLWVFFPLLGAIMWHETKVLHWSDLSKSDRDLLREQDPRMKREFFDTILYQRGLDLLGDDRRRFRYEDKQSPEQKGFEYLCHATGKASYVLGGMTEARVYFESIRRQVRHVNEGV